MRPLPPPLPTAPRQRGAATVSTLIAAIWMLGCTDPEPVLRGVERQPVLKPSTAQPATASDLAEAGYELPAGVLVDIQHLTGRPLTEVRQALKEQLGELKSAAVLEDGKGEELVLERGRVRALDGRIYMLAFDLPEPMRRADVMRVMGLPPQVGESIPTHRDYRLNHERGFRRIRMFRQSRRNELVTGVEVWKWLPGEHVNRR